MEAFEHVSRKGHLVHRSFSVFNEGKLCDKPKNVIKDMIIKGLEKTSKEIYYRSENQYEDKKII